MGRFNYLETRKKLENLDVRFKTNSDTEAILESVSKFGLEKTIKEITHMFAFTLDKNENLFSKRYNIIAFILHYNGNIAFASK